MNLKTALFSILISGFCLCGLKEDFPKIRKMCNFLGSPRLYLIMDKKPISWSLEKHMKFNEILGSGSSGVVAPASFNGLLIPEDSFYSDKRIISEVAVKRMALGPDTLNELNLMKLMTATKTGLRLYGCQLWLPDDEYEASLRGERPMIYVVMDKLSGDLTNSKVLSIIHKKGNKERFQYYKSLFRQAVAFVKKGFILNDIKPENMLYDEKQDDIILIDFGLAQPTETPLIYSGTQPFMCPGKFKRPRPLANMINDLYSLVITIATIEYNDDLNFFFVDHDKNQNYMDCQRSKNDKCRDYLRGRIVEAMRDKGWAKPKVGKTADKTNFLGLIDQILAFENFKYTPDDVMLIMDNEYPEPLSIQKPNSTKLAQQHYTNGLLKPGVKQQLDQPLYDDPVYEKPKKEKDRGCNFFAFFTNIFG